MKTKLILIAIIIILIGSISTLSYLLIRQKDISYRHQQNYNTTVNDLKRFKDKSGADAVTIQELQLTRRELKKSSDSSIIALLSEVNNLKVKNRQLSQVINIKVQTKYDTIKIPVTDTVRIRDTINIMGEYSSEWLDLSIAFDGDCFHVYNIAERNSIIAVGHWYKEKKFIARWFEKRKYAITMKSENPNCKINYIKNIAITSKRGRKK